MWKDDDELFTLMRARLFPAVVGDILDTLGFMHQFLPPAIKPVERSMVVAGRAMPVLETNCYARSEPEGKSPLSQQAFGLLFEALDDLAPNEVYVATGSAPEFALWGGLMTTRALHLKAAGAVLDGYSRDTTEVLELGLPVFSLGGYSQDQGPRGKVVDYRVPVEIRGIRVRPGDIVFGDQDGVLIIPREAEKEAISLALEKADTESSVRKAIKNGMSTVEAFKTFGVM
ncbi:putative demethylmenaquinone methyltransferase [Variovorax paradoxus B4]|uniref:Putative 4-hydroxy-4-methyl-2-oxoglutarate aldolase n=1 Tax=Variovorax paradoxus B4 TaxID=1246301 RepID=T1XJV3_VARPD|nr:RraA family protein [Variovorax paradoxus]AGU52851.1 putative demethylmenaquinone methyltransferase [Variovorax paradoxus B4]